MPAMKRILATTIAAVTIGAGVGILVQSAQATIGPLGGRYITALAPTKSGSQISMRFRIEGDGGSQTANWRLMLHNGTSWVQHGGTGTATVPAGYINQVFVAWQPCSLGVRSYRVEAKWASYSWSQADKSASQSFNCP